MQTMTELRSIHELEALINQAMDILLQVDSAIKAMKPPSVPRKKMTKEQIVKSYRLACGDSQRNNIKKK